MIDPNDFVISRKRKKYRFAKYANSELCFELDAWPQQAIDVVEVGAGTGLFSVELASRHPELSFVAIDVKGDRLQKGAYEAQARGLTNVQFLRVRADQLAECFTPGSVQTVWLTFADPFPRKGSAGRRMSHATYLAIYAKILKPNGEFLLKHDSPEFFNWSLEQLVTQGWHVQELSFDLHESDLADDYKVTTTYEERWLGEGKPTQFVAARMLKWRI